MCNDRYMDRYSHYFMVTKLSPKLQNLLANYSVAKPLCRLHLIIYIYLLPVFCFIFPYLLLVSIQYLLFAIAIVFGHAFESYCSALSFSQYHYLIHVFLVDFRAEGLLCRLHIKANLGTFLKGKS